MHRLDLHPRGWRRRLLSERGMAMPTVLLALVAAFGLAGATVVASVNSQGGSVRDQNVKAGLGAAEAGVANALLRFNRISTSGASDICEPVGGGGSEGEWCPQAITHDFDRGSYTYWVRPTETELQVVATGTFDGVSRRVEVQAVSDSGVTEGYTPFGFASVVGLDSIWLNNKARITADVATNGNIGLDGNESLLECGYAGVGPGKGFDPHQGGSTCDPTEDEVSLPPVNPGDVMTNNSNDRICTLDPCVKADWNADTKRLSLFSGGSITLGAAGGEYNYAFCKVTLNANSYLQVASGATVRIYFGAPEDCEGESNPLVLNSGSKIQPTGSDASDLAILIVGSADQPTSVNLNADAILFDCDQSFILYAPRTDVTLNSRSHVCGGVAGKSIYLNADAHITASNTASEFELPNTEEHYSTGYGPVAFVECSAMAPTPPAPPDAGC